MTDKLREIVGNINDGKIKVVNEETGEEFILNKSILIDLNGIQGYLKKIINVYKYDSLSYIISILRDVSFPECYVLSSQYNENEEAIDDPDRLKYIFYIKEEFYEWFNKNIDELI
ncbi:MAG: hypothetical protein D3904_04180 [Candidatus Electrothrix sp. EH2]|nr:hypothetical protein [Candidatus Electrothrix sp. EH2]